jgi:hypothetical protein
VGAGSGVFKLDPQAPEVALAQRRRMICQLCATGFDSENGSPICPDCIIREPGPLQDNESEERSPWIRPREHPEITIARIARIEAELKCGRYFAAVLFLHQIVTSIAGSEDRPLRLLPRDQHRLARVALEQFKDNFPDIEAGMDLQSIIESGTLWRSGGL